MIAFGITIAIMLAVTLAALFWPLLGKPKSNQVNQSQLSLNMLREQFKQVELDHKNSRISTAEYKAAQEELELAVINNTQLENTTQPKVNNDAKAKLTASLLLVMLPAAALLLYNRLGAPDLITTPPRLAPTQADVEVMVDGLAARLKTNPEDLEGWAILGKSYMLMGRYADAATVFARLLEDKPNSIGVLISYADATAMNANGSFIGAPHDAIKKALLLEPENIKARWMAGMAETELGNNGEALDIWRPLLSELQQQSPEMAAELQRMVAAIESTPDTRPESSLASNSDQTTAAVTLRIKVNFAENLDLEQNDTIFVYARAMQGPPMPLAIQRYTLSNMPAEIILDDTTAMMPAMRLSLFPMVKIDARISKTGSATPQSGDVFGRVENISITQTEVISISVDQVIE